VRVRACLCMYVKQQLCDAVCCSESKGVLQYVLQYVVVRKRMCCSMLQQMCVGGLKGRSRQRFMECL